MSGADETPKKAAGKGASCPVCGKPAAAEHRPFCSDRCRLADLNKWFTGSFIISRDLTEADLDENAAPEEPSP